MSTLSGNIGAFLDMIAFSEGTSRVPDSDDGYRVLVGGTVFQSYLDHPNVLVKLNDKLSSTAAGRYQLLHRYYVEYCKLLGLNDFCPTNQDLIAIQQIKERKAYEDVLSGRFSVAVDKCKNIWASLPGAGYGQHENKLESLQLAYTNAGGILWT